MNVEGATTDGRDGCSATFNEVDCLIFNLKGVRYRRINFDRCTLI